MTFRELCSKEVVQLKDGACLGRVDDLELDADTARIGSLLLLGRPRTDIPAPPPSHGGLLDKLHQWLNG